MGNSLPPPLLHCCHHYGKITVNSSYYYLWCSVILMVFHNIYLLFDTKVTIGFTSVLVSLTPTVFACSPLFSRRRWRGFRLPPSITSPRGWNCKASMTWHHSRRPCSRPPYSPYGRWGYSKRGICTYFHSWELCNNFNEAMPTCILACITCSNAFDVQLNNGVGT